MKTLYSIAFLACFTLLLGAGCSSNETQNSQQVEDGSNIVSSTLSEYVWPTQSKQITTYHGNTTVDGVYSGIAIGTSDGDAVYAIADGIVTATECEGTDSKRNGCFVEITLSNGYAVLYGYNTHIDVSVGDSVVKGQQIATTGLTKNKYAHGALLHLEIKNKDGEQVNPMDLLSVE